MIDEDYKNERCIQDLTDSEQTTEHHIERGDRKGEGSFKAIDYRFTSDHLSLTYLFMHDVYSFGICFHPL